MRERRRIWDEGFEAGRLFGSRCPYPHGSPQAQLWEAGWAESVLQRTGFGGDYRTTAPARDWRDLVLRLLGRN